MTTTDYIIVGAGVLGLSLAYQLRKCGHRVTVLERESRGGVHASGKNAGMIRHLYRNPQLTKWTADTVSNMPESLRESFRQTGSLIVGRTAPDHSEHLFENRQVSVGDSYQDAVYCAEDGLLDSPDFMARLSSLNVDVGVDLQFNSIANAINFTNGNFNIAVGANLFEAPRLVVCTGAWTDQLESKLGVTIDVRAFARHLYAVTQLKLPREFSSELGFWWNEDDSWYLRRWQSGEYLLSVCNAVASDPDAYQPTFESVADLRTRLNSSSLEITDRWHCFRTYSADLLPVMGEDPRLNNLFWFSGFGGFGMSTGYGAAQSFAKYLSGDKSAIPDQFLPDRVC